MMIKNGLSVLLPLKSQKGFMYDVSGGVSSVAAMGSQRFFNTGVLMNRDMFRASDIHNLFRGRQTGGCVRSFIPHQCNKSHMLPYFVRMLASSSASQSSGQGQSQRQESEKKEKECQIKTSSKLQRWDEIASTEVSLNQFPRLMVHGNVQDSKTRRLLGLNPGTGYFEEEQDVSADASNHHGHYELQVPHRHVCRGSAYGWLFLTDENFDMKLLNPFSGAEIQLPPVKTLPPEGMKNSWFGLSSKWSVSKAVFSANPSIEPRPVVLVIYGGQNCPSLAFCKPGDKVWTPLECPEGEDCFHMDVIYHKGQFYVLGYPGYVIAFDIGRRIDDDDHSVKTNLIATSPETPVYWRDWYLMVLDEELVRFEVRTSCFRHSWINNTNKELLERNGDTSDEESDDDDGKIDCNDLSRYYVDPWPPTCASAIKIRRFDASEKQWVKVESLGDKAVFLGFNTSFAISASDYPAGVCIPDSVYFTNGSGDSHFVETYFYEMGIYNIKDKSIKALYPQMDDEANQFTQPAPIWIVNPYLC